MFDPKITEGEWNIDQCILKDSNGKEIADMVLTHGDNAKTIAAVPELLEVYKAAKNIDGLEGELININEEGTEDYVICNKLAKLSKAIKKLEEMHC